MHGQSSAVSIGLDPIYDYTATTTVQSHTADCAHTMHREVVIDYNLHTIPI